MFSDVTPREPRPHPMSPPPSPDAAEGLGIAAACTKLREEPVADALWGLYSFPMSEIILLGSILIFLLNSDNCKAPQKG